MANDNDVKNLELEDIDFSSIENMDSAGIEEIDLDELEKKLEAKLLSHFEDVDNLEQELASIQDPDHMGKVILDEVWHQFGNQIGLDLTDETLIQQYEREHPETYAEIKDEIMKDPAYVNAKNAANEAQLKGGLKDEYTGKDLKPGDKQNVDHVVPRKKIFDDPRRKQANIDTKDLANKAENLAVTNENLNKSKGDKTNSEYINTRETREKTLYEQKERAIQKVNESNKSDLEKRLETEKLEKAYQNKIAADDELMLEAEKKANQAIKKDINKGVAKNVAKKAGLDALKMMAVSALFTMLKEIMNGLVRFFKSKNKSFKLFLEEMKKAIKSFFKKIFSVLLQSGVSAVIGTVISEIFGPIVSVFRKLASLIKQGVYSFIDAIKYLKNPQFKDDPASVKIAQVGKIVTGFIAGGSALFLGEVIEKVLMTYVPVMNISIPLMGSLANIVGLFLASVVCGVVGAIVINLLDNLIANIRKQQAKDGIFEAKNDVLNTQKDIIVVKHAQLDKTKAKVKNDISTKHQVAKNYIKNATDTINNNAVSEEERTALEDVLNEIYIKIENF